MNKNKLDKRSRELNQKPRAYFTSQELQEFQELVRMVNAERFKALQVKGNTALIPNHNTGLLKLFGFKSSGQELAEQLDAVATLMENIKSQWVSNKLTQLGYPVNQKVQVDLRTGFISLQ